MTEDGEVEIEAYFPVGSHLGGELVIKDKGGIGVMFVTPLEGDEFSQRYVVLADWANRQFKLVLSWSPSRAGDERISWTQLNGETIDAKDHPLYGTKNEQTGLYHKTLPPGCYIVREEIEV